MVQIVSPPDLCSKLASFLETALWTLCVISCGSVAYRAGCWKETAVSRARGFPCLFVNVFEQSGGWTFRHPNGRRVSSRAVPLTGLASGGAWVGIRSQALVLSPQLSPHQGGPEGPAGRGRVRLPLCQEVCTTSLAWRACCFGSSEFVLRSRVPFPRAGPSAPPQFSRPLFITAERACWSLKFFTRQSSAHLALC